MRNTCPLLIAVPDVLTAEQVAGVRARLDVATWGSGTASFFWLQSRVRDIERRALLSGLDNGIQELSVDLPEHPAAVKLTGVCHNLLRQRAET